jgi:hypothetical protein
MNKRYISLLAVAAVAFGLAGSCVAAPTAAFIPTSLNTASELVPKTNLEDIQIMTVAPAADVTIIGELKVQGESDASLHDLMVAALNAAKEKGADFVALVSPGVQPTMWVGKMVPVGHGRSELMVGTVMGSEINRISSIPPESSGSLSLIVGRFNRKIA